MIDETYLKTFVPERFLSDERYRHGHIAILSAPAGTRILGMHTPEMKQVAKAVAKDDFRVQLAQWASARPLTGAEGLSHEERMIWGLVLDYARMPLQERLQLVGQFLPSIDNWAICDTFCCNAKWIEKECKDLVWRYICKLMTSSDEFVARTAVVLSLAHFLSGNLLGRTLHAVAARRFSDDNPYYIRMAVAWLFATALAADYEATLPYLSDHRLTRWIHNQSIRKARESFRVPDERKRFLKTLVY
ncbi:MAG: DNA alkylation repair protein [Bacteroidales bacterium]|nr:DNA alkylation repair protein [Bacteroidales bacterium]